MTKEMLIDDMIRAYGMENEYTILFAKKVEEHPEWSWVTAFNVYEVYCEYAEKGAEE